jgi:hypothetical protein
MSRQNQQYLRTTPPTYVAPPTPIQQPQSAEPLEQRVLDLLYPYRDECFAEEENDAAVEAHERKALMLSSTYLPQCFDYLQGSILHQIY